MAGTLPAVHKIQLLQPSFAERAIRYGICSLLLLSIAWVMWQTVLVFREPHASAESGLVVVSEFVSEVAEARDLPAMHLFGMVSSAAEPIVADTDAVVTGIAYASDERSSRAILVIGGNQQSYSLGSVLPGGERVAGIEQDRVVLEHSNERRELRLIHPLADRNADFGSAPALAEIEDPGRTEKQAVSATGVTDVSARLQALRRNIVVPPDTLSGARVPGAIEVRAARRERIARKRD